MSERTGLLECHSSPALRPSSSCVPGRRGDFNGDTVIHSIAADNSGGFTKGNMGAMMGVGVGKALTSELGMGGGVGAMRVVVAW